MSHYMTIVRGLMLSVTLASIFAIFLVTILKVIKRAGFFHRKTAVLVAVSLSILFLVALSQFLVFPAVRYGNAANAPVSYFCLLPGVALAVAAVVVLSQVLLLASRIPPSEKFSAGDGETDVKETKSPPAKPKPRGRPKKQEPGQKVIISQSGRKEKNEAKVSSSAETTRK